MPPGYATCVTDSLHSHASLVVCSRDQPKSWVNDSLFFCWRLTQSCACRYLDVCSSLRQLYIYWGRQLLVPFSPYNCLVLSDEITPDIQQPKWCKDQGSELQHVSGGKWRRQWLSSLPTRYQITLCCQLLTRRQLSLVGARVPWQRVDCTSHGRGGDLESTAGCRLCCLVRLLLINISSGACHEAVSFSASYVSCNSISGI